MWQPPPPHIWIFSPCKRSAFPILSTFTPQNISFDKLKLLHRRLPLRDLASLLFLSDLLWRKFRRKENTICFSIFHFYFVTGYTEDAWVFLLWLKFRTKWSTTFCKCWTVFISLVWKKIECKRENFFMSRFRTETNVIGEEWVKYHQRHTILSRNEWMLVLFFKVLNCFHFARRKKIQCGGDVCSESWVCFSQG